MNDLLKMLARDPNIAPAFRAVVAPTQKAVTVTWLPEYYITEDTVYRVVESGDESDRPGTLVLQGYPLVDGCFAPRDKKKWFRCDRPDAKGVTAEELDAWKALT